MASRSPGRFQLLAEREIRPLSLGPALVRVAVLVEPVVWVSNSSASFWFCSVSFGSAMGIPVIDGFVRLGLLGRGKIVFELVEKRLSMRRHFDIFEFGQFPQQPLLVAAGMLGNLDLDFHVRVRRGVRRADRAYRARPAGASLPAGFRWGSTASAVKQGDFDLCS